MSNISFTIPANSSTMEYPANSTVLTEWWTYAGDKNTDGAIASVQTNVVTGKFGVLRIYPDGVLFYVKDPDFATKIAVASDKTETFSVVKRNEAEILETKTVTVDFEGEVAEAGLYNVNSQETFFNALNASDVSVINVIAPFTITEHKIFNLKNATLNGNGHKISLALDGKGITFTTGGKLVDVNVEKVTPTAASWNSGYNIQLYKGTFEVDNLTSKNNQAALLVNGSTVKLNGTTTFGGQTFGGMEASKGGNTDVSTVTISGTFVNPTETEATPTAWIVNDGSALSGYAFASEKIVDNKTHYYINTID